MIQGLKEYNITYEWILMLHLTSTYEAEIRVIASGCFVSCYFMCFQRAAAVQMVDDDDDELI